MKYLNRTLKTLLFLMCLAAFSACHRQQAVALSSPLCWRSLEPNTGAQDTRFATTEPTLVTNGPEESWLAWEEEKPRILRWAQKRWSNISIPDRAGAEMMRYPVLAMSPSGTPILAVSANDNNGSSALHIARWQGTWQWLGEPLQTSSEPFTHAHEARIAFGSDAQPIVVWSEERHVQLAGLFVARWNGATWQRLGGLTPEGEEYYLSPTMFVDAENHIWLCWREGRYGKRLRVARWDDSSWQEVGRASLQNISEDGGMLTEPSLVVDNKGQAWLLWLSLKKAGGAALFLARWNGTEWKTVAVPRIPEGKKETVWSAKMMLREGVPLIAWSQADSTENHHLFVAEWSAGDQWKLQLTGLHVAEGVSDVNDVNLAPGDTRSFFVSWDEAGKDSRRTRLIQAYSCETGEESVAPPKSIIERETWPKSVNEAAKKIVSELDDESKIRLQKTRKEDLTQYHLSWGMGIRNSLGLWKGNEELLNSCGNGKTIHPDNCSTVIMEAVWDILQASSANLPQAKDRQN